MKPDPNPCHDVYLGWVPDDLLLVLAIGPYIYFFNIFGPFLLDQRGVTHKGDLMGVKTLEPLYYLYKLSGCFGIDPC